MDSMHHGTRMIRSASHTVAIRSARALTLSLLAARANGATLCPSEVARALTGGDADWRGAMPIVHAAVDQLVTDAQVALSWKGKLLTARTGPYRIGPKAEKAIDGQP